MTQALAHQMVLRELKFEKHRNQLAGFQEDVEKWMQQWTVANNYPAVTVAVEEHARGILLWRNKFKRDLQAALGYKLDEELGVRSEDFKLTYEVYAINLNAFVTFVRVNPLGASLADIEI